MRGIELESDREVEAEIRSPETGDQREWTWWLVPAAAPW
jgi:hypothetical protein